MSATVCYVLCRPRFSVDTSTNSNWLQGFLCCRTASTEQAADRAEAAAIDRLYISAPNWKHFYLILFPSTKEETGLFCDAPRSISTNISVIVYKRSSGGANYTFIKRNQMQKLPNCNVSFTIGKLRQAYGHVTLTMSTSQKYDHRWGRAYNLPTRLRPMTVFWSRAQRHVTICLVKFADGPSGITMPSVGLCFTDDFVRSFLNVAPCHSPTGRRIATHPIAGYQLTCESLYAFYFYVKQFCMLIKVNQWRCQRWDKMSISLLTFHPLTYA